AAAEMAAHSRQCSAAGRNPRAAARPKPGARAGAPRAGRIARLRGEVSLRALRRHAATRRHRARAHPRSQTDPDGRAVRGARRHDRQKDDPGVATDLGKGKEDDCVRPPRHHRSGVSWDASDRPPRRAGPHGGQFPRGPAAPAQPRHEDRRSFWRIHAPGLSAAGHGVIFGKESTMAQHRLGLIMNGVTGRMGMNQHLIRSITAIRAQGGVALKNGDRVMPDPILVGRNSDKLAALAKAHGLTRFTTDLDAALKNTDDTVFFDAATTQLRAQLLRKAMAAGKHIYCEKPIAETLADALDLVRAAAKAGIKHGVVQDKLFLPGLLKLRVLLESGFFGRMLSVRGEFGYWVFEGDWQPANRPSWNYRKQHG